MRYEYHLLAAVHEHDGTEDTVLVGRYPDETEAEAARVRFLAEDAQRTVAWEAVKAALRTYDAPVPTVVRSVPWNADVATRGAWLRRYAASRDEARSVHEEGREGLVERTLATFGMNAEGFAGMGFAGAKGYVIRGPVQAPAAAARPRIA